jgi:hypothetical protein
MSRIDKPSIPKSKPFRDYERVKSSLNISESHHKEALTDPSLSLDNPDNGITESQESDLVRQNNELKRKIKAKDSQLNNEKSKSKEYFSWVKWIFAFLFASLITYLGYQHININDIENRLIKLEVKFESKFQK